MKSIRLLPVLAAALLHMWGSGPAAEPPPTLASRESEFAETLVACSGVPDGAPCDDGNACTTNDRCWAGQCVAAGDGGFAQAAGSPISLAYSPWSLVVDDFNQDGRLDLAVADHDNDDSGEVTILLGNGSGAFGQPAGSPVAVGSGPMSVAVADFNLDHKPDLATANWYSGNVTILMGNGAGQFTEAAGSPFDAGATPKAIAAADFNRDGKLDLAIANFVPHNVTILLGDGSGGFAPAAGSPVAAGANPYSIAVGDFDLDAKPDLAISNYFQNGSVTILLGDGSGGFTQAAGSPIPLALRPEFVATGDFNRDGKADLAVTGGTSSGSVSVLLGAGSGQFDTAPGSPVVVGPYSPHFAAVGDFDLDGNPDLAVTPADRIVWLGDGTGRLGAAPGSPATEAWAIGAGRFNGDPRPDVALALSAPPRVTALLGVAALPDCDDHVFCTADSCDSTTGCRHTNLPVGTSCNDGNVCTTGDACNATHVCIGATALNCNDGIPCTTDGCDPATGCLHTVACGDNDPCTYDVCNSQAGCVYPPILPPPEVSMARFYPSEPPYDELLVWDAAPYATTYDVVRGSLQALAVGPGGGDEACVAIATPATTFAEVDTPTGGFFYLVRGRNETCPGIWGMERHNLPSGPSFAERNTTTCP